MKLLTAAITSLLFASTGSVVAHPDEEDSSSTIRSHLRKTQDMVNSSSKNHQRFLMGPADNRGKGSIQARGKFGKIDVSNIAAAQAGARRILQYGTTAIMYTVPINNMALTGVQIRHYYMDVTTGQIVSCSTNGPNGDADLYMRFGYEAIPDTTFFVGNACSSFSDISMESCSSAAASAPTRVYAAVHAYSTFSGLTFQCTVRTPTGSPTSARPTSKPTTRKPTPTSTSGPLKLQMPLCTLGTDCFGFNRNMFDVMAKNAVSVKSLKMFIYTGAIADAEVWTKAGTHVGCEFSAASWTKVAVHDLSTITPHSLSTLPAFTQPITITAGLTQAFYVTFQGPGQVLFSGSTTGSPIVMEDGNLIVYGGMANAYPFGNAFTGYNWNGAIEYTSASSTTARPTTASPTTARPTTTTARPTTSKPTSRKPTTAATPTSASPTTTRPTTANPTTALPTMSKPTSRKPTTASPTTARPTTASPTTVSPTTARHTTASPTTASPTTSKSMSRKPTTARPTTASPTTASPTTASPTTASPTTASPVTESPVTESPVTESPTTISISPAFTPVPEPTASENPQTGPPTISINPAFTPVPEPTASENPQTGPPTISISPAFTSVPEPTALDSENPQTGPPTNQP